MSDLAHKHALPVTRVQQIVGAGHRASRLSTPYQIARGDVGKERADAATQLYWVGFIAACGRIYGRGTGAALVLTIREDQGTHVRRLIGDLSTGHMGPDFCVSSQSGFQAYVRDADLCEVLMTWGIPCPNPADGSVPLEFIPDRLVSHFVRGFLDASAQQDDGPQRHRVLARASQPSITLAGPEPLVAGLADLLHQRCQAKPPALAPAGTPGMVRMTYRGRKTCATIRAFAGSSPA
ncbi:MAG: hypothetical protein HY660_08055 [Armatimonadetes bacterium]|nr:hypothetical protein [Armatimonadota bacterium]